MYIVYLALDVLFTYICYMKKRQTLKEKTQIWRSSKMISTFSDNEIFRHCHLFFNGRRFKVVSVIRNEKPLKAYLEFGKRYYELRVTEVIQPKK